MRLNKMTVATAMFLGCLAMATRAADRPAPRVETPKVLVGDGVDASSMDGIVEAFFKKPGLADEQKVLNFYHWYRRAVYPFRYMASDRRDVLKQINTAGFALCGSQAAVCVTILQAAGYETRVANGNGGPEWGHTFWEVKYDGKWHLFDAMTAFYVMTRDKPPHVASAEEIEADPTLVTKAVEENRCGPEFLYTMRKHEITLEERERFQQETKGADVPWSLLVTKPGSLLGFWTTIAERKKISAGKLNDTSGGRYTPGVLDIALKANERYVRCWHGDKWMTAPSFVKYSPANMAAGGNEQLDPVNFKYFEPYRQDKPNPFNEAVYRTFGNGFLEWTPRTMVELSQGLGKVDNLKQMMPDRERGFVFFAVEDAAKPASLILPVKSPYAAVEIELELALTLPEGAIAGLTLSPVADGKVGAGKKVWASNAKPTTAPDAARTETAGDMTTVVIPLVHAPSPIYEYQLKLDLAKAKGAVVGLKRIKTTFQLNPMVLPGLMPGANKVRVSAATGKIDGGKLVVTYDWFDAPDWTKPQTHTRELVELPAEYEIVLPAGEKLPKMKSLELLLKAD